ncbi:MAG: hypothetical protein ACREKS_20085 [Candidatus Rokuibacteriota bacterium]
MYVAVAARGPCTSDPLVVLAPDQLLSSAPPFDAVQLVAFVDDQVSVDDPPDVTLVGFAVRLTVGATGDVADRVSVAKRDQCTVSAVADAENSVGIVPNVRL